MFGKKHIPQPIVIDISENCITVLRYEADQGTGNTLINAISKKQIPFGLVNTNTIDKESEIIEIIKESLLDIKASDQDELIFGVSGPLVKMQSRRITIEREKPQRPIKLKEWVTSIDDVYIQLDAENGGYFEDSQLPLSLVQISFDSIKIDNEDVVSPLAEKGSIIALDTAITLVPDAYKQSIIRIAQALDMSILGMYHHGYSVGQLILDFQTNKDISALLVDIRFGHTTVSVIQGQVVHYINSFSIGSHSFTQTIANIFQITLDEAETLRQEYTQLQLPRDMARRITDALEPEISLWLQALILSLQNYTFTTPPAYLLLYGEGAQLLGIKEALEYSNWYKSLHFEQKPAVSILTPKQFPHMIDMTSSMEGGKYLDMLGLIHISSIPTDIHLPYRLSE